jgi:methylase of polypeptide subunit release factors
MYPSLSTRNRRIFATVDDSVSAVKRAGDKTLGAAIRKSCQFGPLTIDYDERVLTPRLWTLQQSQWAAEICGGAEPGPILELCAGAGQIGLAAAVLADRDLVQVEADPVAASYARSNAARANWSERAELRITDLDQAIGAAERFPVIIADPPYLPSDEISRWPDDPPMAIDGGADGLDMVNACLQLASQHLSDDGQLLLQVAGPAQDGQISNLLASNPGWRLTRRDVHVIDDQRAIVQIGRPAS